MMLLPDTSGPQLLRSGLDDELHSRMELPASPLTEDDDDVWTAAKVAREEAIVCTKVRHFPNVLF